MATNAVNTRSNADFKNAQKDASKDPERPVNILMILADDLGYGDTSVHPFKGTGIMTPELEKMAAKGTVMTNFHSAAATCTPTRASILTGMYPWRSGIKAVYEYGSPTSNRNDWLPLLPTSAMTFRDANYMTGHSGKWHMGGMRNDDLDMRLTPAEYQGIRNASMIRCPHPGPTQQGFDEYVSVLDGPGAPRQNELQTKSILYSQGCKALLKNDILIGGNSANETLTECEARHALRMIKDSVRQKKPFFVQLWFHAPHGPWENIPGFSHLYPDLSNASLAALPTCEESHAEVYCRSVSGERIVRSRNIMNKYKTMVSSMDYSIGTVLNGIKELGIEEDTLIVFTSDNGPENMTPGDHAGTSGGLRGTKRYLYEGGIRVPTIWQWIGKIPEGRSISTFGITTDFFPTFLEAAKINVPLNVKLDGISLLPILLSKTKNDKKKAKIILNDRIIMWHNDYEGPRSSALWIYDFKIFLDSKDYPTEMYDMMIDSKEKNNLLQKSWKINFPFEKEIMIKLSSNFTKNIYNPVVRKDFMLHRWILSRSFPLLYNFVKYGNEAHLLYLSANEGRKYIPTVESNIRTSVQNPYKFISKIESIEMKKLLLLNGTCGNTLCNCNIPHVIDVPSLPFNKMIKSHQNICPHSIPKASILLTLKSSSI